MADSFAVQQSAGRQICPSRSFGHHGPSPSLDINSSRILALDRTVDSQVETTLRSPLGYMDQCSSIVSGVLVTAIISFGLVGCTAGPMIKKANEEYTFLVAAENLDTPSLIKACDDAKTSKKSCAFRILDASQTNCDAFMNGLVLTENTVNTAFDLTTTLLSALATVFIPLNTVHALSAGAAVSGGWRTAINSDVYAKATAANYAQAIDATYWKDVAGYINDLGGLSENQIDIWKEADTIKTIHRECTLAAANNTIASTMQAAQSKGATGTTTKNLNVVSDGTLGEKVTLTASSVSLPDPGYVTVSYTVKKGDKANDIAKGLAAAVNADSTLKSAKISAIESSPPNSTLALQSPSAAAIVWSTNDLKVISLSDTTSALQVDTKTLTVANGGTADQQVSLTAASPKLSAPGYVTVSYKVIKDGTAKDIATGLAKAVNADPTLKAANISAVENSPADNVVKLHSPIDYAVIWSPGDTNILSLATSAPSPPAAPQLGSVSLTVLGDGTTDEDVALTASSAALPPPRYVTVHYKVKNGDKATDLARGLAGAVNADPTFKGENIGAIESSPPNNTIMLRAPSTAGLIWSPSNPKLVSLGESVAPSSPTATSASVSTTKPAAVGAALQNRK